MTESNEQTFLTALPEKKQVRSILHNDDDDDDDDLEIDIKSSADTDDTPIVKNEIDEILGKKPLEKLTSILIPNTTNDALQDKMSHDDPSPSAVGEHLPTIIPRSVYDYAAMVHEIVENPRQNKLNHDVNAVLGSSDPPAGFGFLHPRFYYLEQKRPIRMEPLRVWRGYNGHVYFSPIQVQHLESDRIKSRTKPRKSTAFQTISSSVKIPGRSRTVSSVYKNKKSLSYRDRITNQHSSTSRKTYPPRITSNGNDLKNNTLVTFVEGEENQEQSGEMWRSVVTCIPVQIQPISKRNQYAIEDLQTLEQEQLAQDSTGNIRQVLPNIRPIPKSKFVYKGLAYKEMKKIPGVNHEKDENNNKDSLKKPLVDYNLAQAYIRCEMNAARTKQILRPPTTATVKDQPLTKPLITVDIREMRKRIVKGTTLGNRPTTQSAPWTSGRANHKSKIGSENIYHRPATSKSSIPLKQTTVLEMPILTKYVNRPRSISRHTPTTEATGDAS